MTAITDLSLATASLAVSVFAYPITATHVIPGVLAADGATTPGSTSTTVVRGVINSWSHRQLSSGFWPKDSVQLTVVGCDLDALCDVACFEPSCGPFAGERFELASGETGPIWTRAGIGGVITLALRPVC